jgi:hypothetical protein
VVGLFLNDLEVAGHECGCLHADGQGHQRARKRYGLAGCVLVHHLSLKTTPCLLIPEWHGSCKATSRNTRGNSLLSKAFSNAVSIYGTCERTPDRLSDYVSLLGTSTDGHGITSSAWLPQSAAGGCLGGPDINLFAIDCR